MSVLQRLFPANPMPFPAILSQELLEEIKKNLKKKIRLPDRIAHKILDYLQSIATLETVSKKIGSKVCKDPDDVKVLELAAQAVPDCIVSGDSDLLVLKKFEGILNRFTTRILGVFGKTKVQEITLPFPVA